MKRRDFLRTGAAGLAMTAVAGFPPVQAASRQDETDWYVSYIDVASLGHLLKITLLIFDPPKQPEENILLRLVEEGERQPQENDDGTYRRDSDGEILYRDPPILSLTAIDYKISEVSRQGNVSTIRTLPGVPRPANTYPRIPLVDELVYFSEAINVEIDFRVEAVISTDRFRDTLRLPFQYTDSGCFLTTACTRAMGLPDNCHELTTLRNYRDTWLMETEEGARLVEEYYADAPAMVRLLDSQPNAAEIHAYLYQTLVRPSVSYIEQGEYREAMVYYREYVAALRDRLFSL